MLNFKNTPSSARVEFHPLVVPTRYTRLLDYPIVMLMFYADDRKEQISLRNARQGIVFSTGSTTCKSPVVYSL